MSGTIPSDADYLVRGYSRAQVYLLVETLHRSEASMRVEIEAWRARMRRGEVSRIEVVNRNTGHMDTIYDPDVEREGGDR